jgi:thermolysin metallopeptidase-like protein
MRLRRTLVAIAAGAFAFTVPLVLAAPAHAFTGTAEGKVFEPNPVVTLQDETLTDQKDADYDALQAAYKLVTLVNLDDSGNLRGDYADVCGTKSCAFSSDGTFLFGRDHTWFEQVMAYHAVTQAQLYIQSLGFTNVNNEPQVVRANQFGGDNSFYDPKKDTITVGKGGVDDGEDLEVIWHEYGHAIQDDQVPGFGVGHDSGSIGEGFGDYWAFTMSEPLSGGFDPACIGDWDSVSYTVGDAVHCLRRVDLDLTVDDQTGRIHHDGQIWSRALYDIHNELGRTTADQIILQAQFDFGVDPSFAAAAQATVDAAEAIAGHGAAKQVERAFEDRGIL